MAEKVPNVAKMRALFEPERDKAWKTARDRAAGDEIDASTFKVTVPGKYPPWLIAASLILCIIVLVAAFQVSAYKLYQAGAETFCDAVGRADGISNPTLDELMANDYRCPVVGTTMVIMAETGQIVFFIALAVLATNETARKIFWSGVGLSTLIALIGNAHVSSPWNHGGFAFAYLQTFGPPLLVMAIGYVLKETALFFIENRRERLSKLEMAITARQAIYDKPASHPDWYRIYSQALRDAIKKANSREKIAIRELTSDEWAWLVRREWQNEQWMADPATLSNIELDKQVQAQEEEARKQAEQAKIEQAKIEQAQAQEQEIRKVEPPRDLADAPGQVEVWLNNPETGTWSARSAITGYLIGTDFPSEDVAVRRVKTYNYHRQRRDSAKVVEEQVNGRE